MNETDQRIQERYQDYFQANAKRVDKLFGVVMLLQLIAGVCGAVWISPRTWSGSESTVHLHVLGSLIIGIALTAGPLFMIKLFPGRAITRHCVAVAQMLFSGLLIHISGGRIETHFHIFGSLAFLAFYRDWRLFIPATIIVATDHFGRAVFWPESVFGVLTASPWRALEHAGWVLFEDAFLVCSCIQAKRETMQIAKSQVVLEKTNEQIEETIRLRTGQLEKANESLKDSDERYQLVVHGTQEAVWDWDLKTNKIYYAPNWVNLLGLPEDKPIGDSPDVWFSRITSRNLSVFQSELNRHISGETERFDMEVELRLDDGSTRWMLCRAAASRDQSGAAVRMTGSLNDVSELKEAQHKLRRLAEFDQLTGLPNRAVFLKELSEAMKGRRQADEFAVAFFDFDRFKVINDSLGHGAGDALLKSIANRFHETLRDHDTVSRFGGDEFVVLLRELGGEGRIEQICERLLSVFSRPHLIDGHHIVSTASIGVVSNSSQYTRPEEMIRDADAAMYRAKSDGRDRFQIFDSVMHDEAMLRLNLENELRDAIDGDQLELYYQPIVETSDGSIAGFEALVRWNHPQNGMISPGSFIPLAEETGIIVEMGDWVFREACEQLAEWRRDTELGENLLMTVNVSRMQMIHPKFIGTFRTIIEETGVPPEQLCLEITESSLMSERTNLVDTIHEMKGLGVKLALDDFGTGHSSLSCLHSFPIDVLKIDQSFIRNLGLRVAFSAVLNSIVSLGQHLKMRVIGEGIESLDQLANIQALECEWAQGYYFSKPVNAKDATDLITSRPHWKQAA